MAVLPVDLFHLLSEQLARDQEFSTLYNCIVSSKHLSNAGAVAALYRISHESPVKEGGNEGLPLAVQDLTVQKWTILWRTIILSAMGKTMYPYCRHLRFLDLRDFGSLLEDEMFRGRILQHFFEGELARFHFVTKGLGKARFARLDRPKIVLAIGDEVTQKAPLLEAISEPTRLDVLSGALLTWIPRLVHLQRLELFDGKAFADEQIRNLLHAHCPNLEMLKIYRSSHPEADHALAAFISGMPENKLVYFENHSDCGIGTETCLALNTQGQSLTQLKLALTEEGILALGLLQGCTALRTLSISSDRVSVDLKATQNDVYLEIIEWLKNCVSLRDISFQNIVSAPDLMMPVLLNKNVTLEELDINATEDATYVVKDHHDFHQALNQQPTIRRLHLRADPEPPTLHDNETLINAFCALKGLRELRLTRISDYFTDEHVILLAEHLTELEEFSIGGYGISDAVLINGVAKLKKLKAATFGGITTFTLEGLMNYIDQLGPENQGLVLSVDMADPDSGLSQEEQDLIRELVKAKVDGRFEYQFFRDPNMPEFDGSDDSD